MENGVEFHEVRVSAPGKVILHGEHAVVYGKTALAVSLGLRTSIVVKEIQSSKDSSVNIHFPSVDLNEKIDLKSVKEKLFVPPCLPEAKTKLIWLEPSIIDHEKHLKNVDDYLQESRSNFADLNGIQQNALRGFLYTFSGILGSISLPVYSMEVSLESQLTAGAGTGSSASFAVCLAGAFIQLIQLKSGLNNADFNERAKKIISDWAYNCERIMHGSPSGIDNLTCTYGSLISFRRGTAPKSLALRPSLRVLLVDTRVSRQTSALTGRVRAFREWNMHAVDAVMEACDHVALKAIEILESISSSEHNADVKEYYQRLEALWEMNHGLLAALGVSHPALEAARTAARKHDLVGKLTGAGGGGYAIVLIPPYVEQTTVCLLSAELTALGYGVTDTRLGGAGVRIDP